MRQSRAFLVAVSRFAVSSLLNGDDRFWQRLYRSSRLAGGCDSLEISRGGLISRDAPAISLAILSTHNTRR